MCKLAKGTKRKKCKTRAGHMCIGVHAQFSQIYHSEMEVCEVEQCFCLKVAVLQM